jgi:hypothetical protein
MLLLPELARNGHGAMSDLSPLSGVKRKLDFGAVRSAFDPTATLAVHCGNGFDASFSPYRSTRLSRYDASSRAKGLTCNGASSSR